MKRLVLTLGVWLTLVVPAASQTSQFIGAGIHPVDLANDVTGELVVVWVTPAFNAGDFTGSDSMTWTVEAGDVTTFQYTVSGKVMTFVFVLNTTTVGGTPASALEIAIPGGFTSTTEVWATAYAVDSGDGTSAPAPCNTLASGTRINCFTNGGSTVWTAATNTTQLKGQITFEID